MNKIYDTENHSKMHSFKEALENVDILIRQATAESLARYTILPFQILQELLMNLNTAARARKIEKIQNG